MLRMTKSVWQSPLKSIFVVKCLFVFLKSDDTGFVFSVSEKSALELMIIYFLLYV